MLFRSLRYVWAFPTTAIGLVIVALTMLTRGHARVHTGVLECWGGFASWALRRLVPLPGGASAMTLGHVVIARDEIDHDLTRSHERVHVRQYERWGPFFIPAYFAFLGWYLLRPRGPEQGRPPIRHARRQSPGASQVILQRLNAAYYDNPFEREAYAVSDGTEGPFDARGDDTAAK